MATQLELSSKPFIELQIDAFVKDNRIREKHVKLFIRELQKRLKSIDDERDIQLGSTKLPFLHRPNCLDTELPVHLKFSPPESVDIVGGFKTLSSLAAVGSVDLAVSLPKKWLEKKDIKNQRYHLRRALYLAQLAHLLAGRLGRGFVDKLDYSYHQGDVLRPILVITPKDIKLKKARVTFQLFVCPSKDNPLKASMLQPDHGNIAPRWFFEHYSPNLENDELFFLGDSDTVSTPFYNSTILVDIEMHENSEILYNQIAPHESIRTALMLTKIWLYQRDLHTMFSFVASMFVAYLQTKRSIHPNMSSYQIFKVIIKSLANSSWSVEGLSFYDDSANKIAALQKFYPVVFLSPSGNSNLCYNISLDIYERLKHEASIVHRMLEANLTNMFELIFLKKVAFADKFDAIVHVPKFTKRIALTREHLTSFMDRGVLTTQVYAHKALDLLKRALQDRVHLIQQNNDITQLNYKWNLKSAAHDPSVGQSQLSLGLLLDPENSLRIVDVGPDAKSSEAEEFRQFWDPKSELRVQNGVISETVVWHVASFSKRRSIIKYILTHALKKLGIQTVVLHYTVLERFIDLQNVSFEWLDQQAAITAKADGPKKRRYQDHNRANEDTPKTPVGVGEETFQKAMQAYNELNKMLRSVEGVKHSINAIQPVSAHLRGCSVFPSLPVALQGLNKSLKRRRGVTLFPENFDTTSKILHIEPIEILITLQTSTKWPSDYEAAEAAKVEYLLELGQGLKLKDYCIKFAQNYLDVMHGQFVFRIRVRGPKDVTLASNKLDQSQRKIDFEVMPRVHAALDQLYREQPAFGLTCRLVKRWLACQLMTDHMADIVVELLIAYIFLEPSPYTQPASSLCGFRRFLSMIASHDWKNEPIIVNFDKQLKLDEITRLRDSMGETRDKFPSMVVCTPFDGASSPWTRAGPGAPVLDLIRRVCAKAHGFIESTILPSTISVHEEARALFRPSFKLFNMLIKLRTQVVQNFFMAVDAPKTFRLEGRESNSKNVSAFKVMPIVDMNIVEQYVRLLRDKFDNVALFFYDKYGQRVIGVVMKPDSERILGGDIDKFIADIKQLGSKLVDTVTIVSSTAQ